jgi:hypothetical protein
VRNPWAEYDREAWPDQSVPPMWRRSTSPKQWNGNTHKDDVIFTRRDGGRITIPGVGPEAVWVNESERRAGNLSVPEWVALIDKPMELCAAFDERWPIPAPPVLVGQVWYETQTDSFYSIVEARGLRVVISVNGRLDEFPDHAILDDVLVCGPKAPWAPPGWP